jgi:hypothetical protein
MTDPDDELLDLYQIIDELDIDPDDARAVLGPHSALPRWEACERWEMILRERGEPRP